MAVLLSDLRKTERWNNRKPCKKKEENSEPLCFTHREAISKKLRYHNIEFRREILWP